jgi:zinc transport system substrate-binding protein
MEPWVEKMLKGVNDKLLVVDASQGVELLDDHDGEEHHKHDHDGKDPHIWLDLANAQQMVTTITHALAQKDPANAKFYEANAVEYKQQFTDLDQRFKTMLATVKHKSLIYGGHFAFGYFAKRYGLTHDSPYQGFSPNAEPRPKSLAKLINKLKQSGMNYIYHEELIDPKVARTIAQETGAKLELLHGAHNISQDELQRGVTFLELMETNFNKLKVGLVAP